MWMNQYDIEEAMMSHHDCPNVRKGVRLLYNLMQAVNEQSDGWPYWQAPSKAAEKLMDLLRTAGNLNYGTHGKITDAQLKAAITPIKSMVTRQKKLQARFGNKFEFNVAVSLCGE